jgi:hypothetical protein
MTTELKLIPHDPSHNIGQRLNAVMREVRYVQKDKNVDNKYDVATYDALLEVARDSLIEHGILVETDLISGHSIETGGVSKSGAKWMRYQGEYEVRFVNIDNLEEFRRIKVSADADDLGDKSPGKAQTYATKAAIKKQLLIRTGDDEEERAGPGNVDTTTGEVVEAAPRQRPAAKAEGASKPAAAKPNGKIASDGEIAFTKKQLGSDENVAAFCKSIGIESLAKLPDGAGKQARAFVQAAA